MRILGYSLPESDSYIKYLLRAAIVASPYQHLKTIDVLCRDSDGTTRKRYDAFIRFPGYRFKAATVEEYLELWLDLD